MNRQLWSVLSASILLIACGGKEGGGQGGGGGLGGSGGTEDGSCSTQRHCVGGDEDFYEVNQICLPGGCTQAGSLDEFGDIRRGEMLVTLRTQNVDATNIHSGYLRIFYPLDTNGEPIDCDRIYATPGRLDSTLNVVKYHTTSLFSSGYKDFSGVVGSIDKLPVNDESTLYLVHVALFSGDRDTFTLEPTGVMLVEGCQPGMLVAEGTLSLTEPPPPDHVFDGLIAKKIP